MKEMDNGLLNAFDVIESMMTNVSKKELERDDFLTDIAVKIIKLRLNLKLTQAEVAAQCSMTQAMISKMEGGLYNPSVAKLWEYVTCLGGEIRLDIRPPKSAEHFIRLDKELQNFIQSAPIEDVETKNPMRMKYDNSNPGSWLEPQEEVA